MPIRPLLYLVAVIIACLGLWFGYEHVKQIGYKQCETEMQAKLLQQALAYADAIKKAEEQRDANQTTIDRLVAESHRVQVHIPVCPTPGGKDQDGTAGVASARIDEYMAEAKSAIDAIGKRCAELNIDAIKINTQLNAQ